jgi:molybdopterin-guanine dinucleotide biosynthesis protein A
MLSVIIQAGGRSSRMGQDKALTPFLGQPFIAYLIERVAPLTDDLAIITNRPDVFAFLNRPSFPDLLPGIGPLGGLYTGLAAARNPYVAVIACDMPFVNLDLLRAQQNLLITEKVDLVVPLSREGLEPFHAVYFREPCLTAVKTALEAGERRMAGWYGALRVRVMKPEEMVQYDSELRSFTNMNTPDEFQAAEIEARLIREHCQNGYT